MRRTTASIGILGVAAALSLTACGSSNSSSPSSTGGGSSSSGGGVTAACKLTNPPKSGATLPKTVNLGKTSGKVGVILPDTTSSTRYTLYDAPLLTKALKAAGDHARRPERRATSTKFASIAQSMIGEGVKVLIIDSIDAASGAGVEKAATRPASRSSTTTASTSAAPRRTTCPSTTRTSASCRARRCSTASSQQGVTNPKIIMMDGGTDVDNNAVLFKKGAHEVLDRCRRQLKIVSEAVVKGWDGQERRPAFTQALTAAGGRSTACSPPTTTSPTP